MRSVLFIAAAGLLALAALANAEESTVLPKGGEPPLKMDFGNGAKVTGPLTISIPGDCRIEINSDREWNIHGCDKISVSGLDLTN
jgi:hypothetical protein